MGEGLPTLQEMKDELDGYWDVLLGRDDPPINHGVLTMMDVASAYFARASEMAKMILRAEQEGTVPKGSNVYKFRTGELRQFIDVAKATMETGSRHLTAAQLDFEMKEQVL